MQNIFILVQGNRNEHAESLTEKEHSIDVTHELRESLTEEDHFVGVTAKHAESGKRDHLSLIWTGK